MGDDVKISINIDGNAAQVAEQLKGQLAGLEDQTQKVATSGKSMEDTFKSINSAGLNLAAAAAPLAASLGAVVKTWIDAAEESEKVTAQLNARLEATHDAVGLTADQIKRMATNLQDSSAVNHNAILQGQDMLLTFTNIGKNAFPIASQAMLDMATAMNGGAIPSGEQLSQTAIQMGKALNDPVKGITALHRVGVEFTDQQKEQIKTLVASNDMFGAQKVILDELAHEFGGSASAAAQTFAGQTAQLQNKIETLNEKLGEALVPILKEMNKVIGEAIDWFEGLDPKTQEAIAQAVALGAALAAAAVVVGLFLAALNPVVIAIVAIVAAYALWKAKGEELWLSLELISKNIEKVYDEMVLSIRESVLNILNALGMVDPNFRVMAVAMKDIMQGAKDQLNQDYKDINDLTAKQTEMMRTHAEDDFARMTDQWNKSTGDAKDKIHVNLENMKSDFAEKFPGIRLTSTDELEKMRKEADDKTMATATAIAKNMEKSAGDAAVWGEDFVKNLGSGMNNNQSWLSSAVDNIKSIMSQVHQSYNPLLPAQLWGQDFVGNISQGLKDGMPNVSDALYKIEEKFQGFKDNIQQITDTSAQVAQLQLLSAQLNEISSSGQDQVSEKQKEMQALQKKFAQEDHDAHMAELKAQLSAAKTVDEQKSISAEIDRQNTEDERQAQLDAVQSQIQDIQDTTKASIKEKQTEIDATKKQIADKVALQKQMLDTLNTMQQQYEQQVSFEYQKSALEEQATAAKTATEKDRINKELQKLISDEKLAEIKDSATKEIEAAQDTYNKEKAFIDQLMNQYNALALVKAKAVGGGGSGSVSVAKGKAEGGPVSAGTTYPVGEQGVEMFTPTQDGYITPNNKLGGTTVINININGHVSSKEIAQEYADIMVREFQLHSQAI